MDTLPEPSPKIDHPAQEAAAPTEAADKTKAPLTPGEQFYEGLQFSVGKVTIMAFTAAIAYTARYGKNNYGAVPNYLKQFEHWFNKKLLTNKTLPLEEKGEIGKRLAGALTNTTLLVHGGNMFGPIMKWMENSHEDIANYVNRRWGKPEDVKIAHERLKDKPKQTWGDVLKGRMAAWTLVFTSFMTADTLAGKDKKTGMYYFDKYEEWFARKMAGMTKNGRDIGKVPLTQALTKAQDANKMYRFGKIFALDIYATSAAIVIWNAVSRMSAKKRHEKNCAQAAADDAPDAPMLPVLAAPLAEEQKKAPPRVARFDPVQIKRGPHLHSEQIAAQRDLESATTLSV